MTGRRHQPAWVRRIAALFVLLVACALPCSGEITLLVSEARAYERAAAACRDRLGGHVKRIIRVPRRGPFAAEVAAQRDGTALIIAVGPDAVDFARRAMPDVPLVYAMVREPASRLLPEPGDPAHPRMTGVTMQPPIERQMQAIVDLLPGAKRVGVLFDPTQSKKRVEQARRVAASLGLELVPAIVRSEGDVMQQARVLLPDVDVLWAVPDTTAMTPSNARALILLSLRMRKPFFGLSDSYVRTGALAAVTADPEAVGRRAAEMALQLMQDRSKPIAAESAPETQMFLNRATARRLGIELKPADLQAATELFPQ